jgi:hypothetical protein
MTLSEVFEQVTSLLSATLKITLKSIGISHTRNGHVKQNPNQKRKEKSVVSW